MKKVFLSFSFRDQDRMLVNAVDQLLASHDILSVTGRRLGGDAITPAVMGLIDGVDGLVALMTRRDQLQAGGWISHPWVQDELNYARAHGKRTIALVEDGVIPGGAFAENERIPLNRDAPFEAFLALSETIGLWKQEAGRMLKVRLMPDAIAQQAVLSQASCRYRFLINGQFTPWKEALQVPETGGTFVYLSGVRDDYLIQILLDGGLTKWLSPATAQWVTIEMLQAGGGL